MSFRNCVLVGLILFVFFTQAANAAEVGFEWDAPENSEWGTRIYIGTESGNYRYSEDAGVGTTQILISNLVPGKVYFFAARHYWHGMESKLSKEISHEVPSEITILPQLPAVDESIKEAEMAIRKI